MQVVLTQPRGFCAGLTRVLEIVERALPLKVAPVCVFHEILHNQWVVDDLHRRGVVFGDDIESVSMGSTLIFGAHGVATQLVAQAQRQGLKTIDATCPLVSKLHQQAQRFVRMGHTGGDRSRWPRQGGRHIGPGQCTGTPGEHGGRSHGA